MSVRFGNVLGSNGSVIPLFQEQIRQNQAITITHPEITRFFMTVSEAVSLVLQAFAIGRNGDILVLDMGEPVRVADLARTLAHLSGKSRQEFKFIGLRPGEKLFEELFYSDERVFPSACAKIACAESVKLAWPALKRGLDHLHVAMSLGDRTSILAQLQQIVPQFSYTDCDQAEDAQKQKMSPSPNAAETPTEPLALSDMPQTLILFRPHSITALDQRARSLRSISALDHSACRSRKCLAGASRKRCAAVSAVMSRWGMPSIS